MIKKRIYHRCDENKHKKDDGSNTAEIDVAILDLPKIHDPNDKLSQEFAQALAKAPLDIFRYRSIQYMISLRWPLSKSYVLWNQLLPYAVFLTVYLLYTYFILKKHISDLEDEEVEIADRIWDLVFGIPLILNSGYFLY